MKHPILHVHVQDDCVRCPIMHVHVQEDCVKYPILHMLVQDECVRCPIVHVHVQEDCVKYPSLHMHVWKEDRGLCASLCSGLRAAGAKRNHACTHSNTTRACACGTCLHASV